MLLNCGVGEDPWESLDCRQIQPVHLKGNLSWIFTGKTCWSWISNTLAMWCEELTYLKRPWCWKRLKAGRERDDRGWDGWMASLTQWIWVWASSGSWWWTGKLGVLQSMGSQRVGYNWVTELNSAEGVLHSGTKPEWTVRHILPRTSNKSPASRYLNFRLVQSWEEKPVQPTPASYL